jgi:APA family basic amino acid/polyamine antiporter
MVFAGPRVYYAMARDGVFFKSAARIHPRFHTPAVAIVGQTVWSALLVLSGSADALTKYTGFSVVLFAGVAVLALFVLRFREPDAPRPFKAIGYPVAPAFFALAMALIVANALYADLVVPIRDNTAWGPAAAGLIVVSIGVPVYFLFKRNSAV